jgi:hypothetical protein
MLRVFTGHDSRESIGWHVFVQSLLTTSSNYVLMPPLSGQQRDGTNAFTYARFLVPEICKWEGWALFVDGADMLLRSDISEILDYRDSRFALQVVKHNYKTKAPRKYVGTDMEADNMDYPRKNWSSVILWNCEHIEHYNHRDDLKECGGKYLHRFQWLTDDLIGELPIEWNWLDEYGENPEAKLLHYTTGIPGFSHYAQAPHAREWKECAREVNRGMA